MNSKKTLTLMALSSGIFLASCGSNEQKTTETTTTTEVTTPAPAATAPADTDAVAKYNKDEAEMLDKTNVMTYKSKDGKSKVKISYIEKDNGNKYVMLQKDNGKAMELSLTTAHDGADVYSHAETNTIWESRDSGGSGTLVEQGKKTQYDITNE